MEVDSTAQYSVILDKYVVVYSTVQFSVISNKQTRE